MILDAGEPIFGEIEHHPNFANIPSTPTDLREALQIFDKSDFVKKALGILHLQYIIIFLYTRQ